MRNALLLSAALFTALAAPAFAQDGGTQKKKSSYTDPPLISTRSMCVQIVNDADYLVIGSLESKPYESPEGEFTHYKSNFRLDPGKATKACSTGPFYPDYRLRLVIRSLVPVFTCLTHMNGTVHIEGEHLPEGGVKTSARCL